MNPAGQDTFRESRRVAIARLLEETKTFSHESTSEFCEGDKAPEYMPDHLISGTYATKADASKARADVLSLQSSLLTAIANHSSLADRFKSVCAVLANVIQLSLAVPPREDMLSSYLGLIRPISHMDGALLHSWNALLSADANSFCRTTCLVVEDHQGRTVIDRNIVSDLATENKRLMYELEDLKNSRNTDLRLENVMNRLLSFDYVLFRFYQLIGTIPAGDVYFSFGDSVRSSDSSNGDWKGESVLTSFSATDQMVLFMRSSSDDVLVAQSDPIELMVEVDEVVLHSVLHDQEGWIIKLNVLLALCPSSVATALHA